MVVGAYIDLFATVTVLAGFVAVFDKVEATDVDPEGAGLLASGAFVPLEVL